MNRPRNISATPATRSNWTALRGTRLALFVALAVAALASRGLLTVGSAPDESMPVAAASSQGVPRTSSQVREAYGKLPLSFEANRGQADGAINFLARGAGYTLALSPTKAVFALAHREHKKSATLDMRDAYTSAPRRESRSAVLRMNLVGANRNAAVSGLDELEGKVNYLKGSDPSRWLMNISTFGRVRYTEVYPGIDLLYYGNQRQLEYDFVVGPGRDASAVRLRFEGANKVALDAAGDLLLTLGKTVIRQPKPVLYQEVNGARVAVEGSYTIRRDGQVGFAVGKYDRQLPLIIDPVLVYSTYLGGSGSDEGFDLALDTAGNAYICGHTSSTNFPTVNAVQATFGGANFVGGRDGFVTKLNAAGTALVYSTYLGGDGDDRANKIAVDSSGNAYVAGETTSTNFPTANAIQGIFGGGLSDGFVVKLNAEGKAFVYSTFLGGNIFDAAHAINIDSAGNAYVTGRTTSANFPTLNPFQSAYSGGPGADAFVTKINAAGTALVYSTYLGGNAGNTGFTAGFSIDVDSTGSAYVTGQTRATDFPTANAIQATFGGGFPDGDGFVTKLTPEGTALVYSTYLGGSDNDIGFEIALDSANNAYVTGSTFSSNFPTLNPYQKALSGTSDAFVTKINADGTTLAYSTYLGGTGGDSGNGIAVDSSGSAYIAAGTTSTDVPMFSPIQGTNGGGGVEAFVTRLNPSGTALLFSTYLGGSGNEAALDIELDSAGSMYVTGRTSSTNFPVANPIQNANGGDLDVFVSKLSETPPTAPPTLGFSQSGYTVSEGGVFVAINVVRSGNISQPASVTYTTSDTSGLNNCSSITGIASSRCDYTIATGKLSFAAGEASKTVIVSIIDDSYAEGTESFTFTLSDPLGGTFGTATSVPVTITDNELVNGVNPIDSVDFFIRQHYLDFLGREPDPVGFQGWRNILNNCAAGDKTCDRVEVSSGFYRSEEFQTRGYFIYRFYKVLPDPNNSFIGRVPHFAEFMPDLAKVSGFLSPAQLEANKAAFVLEFMNRPEFKNKYDSLTTPTAYVDEMLHILGLPNHPTRGFWIDGLTKGTLTRADVLRGVVESAETYQKIFNEAFVVMHYFGYLRRDPDIKYLEWIQTLNQTGDYRTMISGFLNSAEYRQRFGPS
jgi:hypothetical protein